MHFHLSNYIDFNTSDCLAAVKTQITLSDSLHLITTAAVLKTHKMLSTYWLPKNATSNQNARPWMVPACEITNDNGISMLCKSDSCAVWKFTVYFSDRDRQMRMSKVSWRRNVAGPL